MKHFSNPKPHSIATNFGALSIRVKASIGAALVCGVLAAPTYAQVNIDLSTASVTKDASEKIVISNITYLGKLYDLNLQWNPYDLKFDIVGIASVSGNARVCNLGTVATPSASSAAVSLTSDSVGRTITIRFTLQTLYSTYWDFFTENFKNSWTVVQSGRELNTISSTTSVLASTDARIAKTAASATLSWYDIPTESVREAVITGVPSYIDLNAPLTKVLKSGKEYVCQ